MNYGVLPCDINRMVDEMILIADKGIPPPYYPETMDWDLEMRKLCTASLMFDKRLQWCQIESIGPSIEYRILAPIEDLDIVSFYVHLRKCQISEVVIRNLDIVPIKDSSGTSGKVTSEMFVKYYM